MDQDGVPSGGPQDQDGVPSGGPQDQDGVPSGGPQSKAPQNDAGNMRKRRLQFMRGRKRRRNATTMTMMEHLGELRNRLIVSLLVFLVFSIVAFILFDPIVEFLLRPLCSLPKERLGTNGCKPIFTGALEPISVRLKVTALTGLVFASPVWLYQLWAFITPGLTAREKRYALPFVGSSVVLFLLGTTFAYLTLPAGLRFLVSLGGDNLEPFLRASEYLNFVTLIIVVFGATFELPLLLFFLGLVGVVKVEQLRRLRRHAIVVIALVAALVTPSQDPYTMLAMAVPLYGLYEIVILLLSAVAKRRAKREGSTR